MKRRGFLTIIGSIALTALLVIGMAGCSHDTDLGPEAAFYGTWVCAAASNGTVIISANKLQYFDDYDSYTLEGLTWTPNTSADADYPTGYVISGVVTQIEDFSPCIADRVTEAGIGDTAYDCWNIHTNGQSLAWMSWASWDGYNYVDVDISPYIK